MRWLLVTLSGETEAPKQLPKDQKPLDETGLSQLHCVAQGAAPGASPALSSEAAGSKDGDAGLPAIGEGPFLQPRTTSRCLASPVSTDPGAPNQFSGGVQDGRVI